MVDDKEARLTGPCRQSSREAPPARPDRDVMEPACGSVRQRSLSPSVNYRVVAAAIAGICMIGVLLVLLLPGQTGVRDQRQGLRDAGVPDAEYPEKRRYLQSAEDEAGTGMPGSAEQNDAAGRQHFDFYSSMPEVNREVPAMEPVLPSIAAPASPPVQTGRVAVHVLQITGFSSLAQAEAMQDKLEFMRLDASIRQGEDTRDYRILVGPYTDLNDLDRVQAQLGKRGIKSTREQVQ